MEAGADAFVLKRAIATELLAAVELVRGGRSSGPSTGERSPIDVKQPNGESCT
jgi:DNA-binding NarL/FixJ family response regulator